MANRVTDSEVKEILDTDISDTTPFIDAANLIITDKLDGEHSDALLKEIERWLAAHLVAINDQRESKIKVSGRSVTYQGKTDMGLNATTYGQQVLVLDTSNKLAESGKPRAFWQVGEYD